MTWFDLVHYTLVGFGVCFILVCIIALFQWISGLMIAANGNKEPQSSAVYQTQRTEEHHVHHVHHTVEHDVTGIVGRTSQTHSISAGQPGYREFIGVERPNTQVKSITKSR